MRGVAEVLPPGQAAVEADRVGQVADPALDLARLAFRIQPHDRGRPAGRFGEAEEHQDGRGLAGAVLAEEAEDLARSHLEVQGVHCGQRPVALRQRLGPDDRLGRRRRRRLRLRTPLDRLPSSSAVSAEGPPQADEHEDDQADRDGPPLQRGLDGDPDVGRGTGPVAVAVNDAT